MITDFLVRILDRPVESYIECDKGFIVNNILFQGKEYDYAVVDLEASAITFFENEKPTLTHLFLCSLEEAIETIKYTAEDLC